MTHNGGQLQVNLNFVYNETPFINILKDSATVFFPINGTPGTDWAALLSASGYPSAMPAGGGAKWRKYVTMASRVGDTWELIYPSQHTVTVFTVGDNAMSEVTIAPGHKRFTITAVGTPGAPFTGILDITAMSGNSWTEGISLYRTTDQADFDADPNGFNPFFLARLGYGEGKTPFGLIRAMNWGGGFGREKLFAHRHEVSDVSWMSELIDVRYFSGTASKTLNHYTTGTRFPGNPAAWADGQVVQFWMPSVPSHLAITATTMGAVTSFQCVGHGLTNGEEVELDLNAIPSGQLYTAMHTKSLVTGLPPKYVITKTDDDNFTIPLNSTGFSAVGAFSLFPVITVGDGTLAQKRCISCDMAGQYESSYNDYASGGVITGVYHSQFDAIVLRGNQGTIGQCIPLEIQCKLANKLRAHLWICVPMYMQGAEERAYIQLARDNLDAELLLVIEKANEIWNTAFNSWHYAESLAALRGSGTTNSPTGHGIMVNDLADNAAAVLGALAINYRVVMSLQNVGNYAGHANVIQCPFLSSGNAALYPGNKVDAIATAPYVRCNISNPNWIAANYPGWVECLQDWLAGEEQAAFDWYTAEQITASSTILGVNQPLTYHINAGHTGAIDNWVSGKSAYPGRRGGGIEIWNYEGMDHNVGSDEMDGGFPTGGVTAADIFGFLCAYKRSSQYGWLSGRILANLKDAGVVWPSVYTAAGNWSEGGMWGQWPINDIGESAPPGWEACYNFNKGMRRYRLNAS